VPSPDEELEVSVSIQHTTPGTAFDDRLRREQAQALLDLLASRRRRCQSGAQRARRR
jgi:hypothetical protein